MRLNDQFELEGYANWGIFDIKLLSNVSFMTHNITYDDYSKSNFRINLDYEFGIVGSVSKINKVYESVHFSSSPSIEMNIVPNNQKDAILTKRKLTQRNFSVENLSKVNMNPFFNEPSESLMEHKKIKKIIKRNKIYKGKLKTTEGSPIVRKNPSEESKTISVKNFGNNIASTSRLRWTQFTLPPLSYRSMAQVYPTLGVSINKTQSLIKHNPGGPLDNFKRISGNNLRRRIEAIKLRYLEISSPQFNISDLFEERIKILNKMQNDDYINSEWLRIYNVVGKYNKFLRQLFIGYNFNYTHKSLKLDFNPEVLHLDHLSKMTYPKFKELSVDITTELTEFELMECFYISSNLSKKLLCIY